MSRDRFSFEGLTAIEHRLVRLADEISYIVVQDRTAPKQDETLGRLDFTAEATLPYCEPSLDRPEEDWPAAVDRPEPTSTEIAEAAGRWIRYIATRCTVGDAYRRFRVKAWGPKGNRMVDSGQFVCRNHDADIDLQIVNHETGVTMPEPDFEHSAERGAAKGIQALGDFYAQWGQIVLGSIGQLQGINNQMSARLHRQLAESRDQVDQLVASILEHRFQQASASASRHAEERDRDTRTELARDAIHQVGEAARVLLGGNAVPPEMTEVVGTLSQSTALVDALRDPAVQALIKDPANLDQLAMLIRATAQQASASSEPYGSSN
ncbi:MAG: hypothetical protein AAGA48_37140 [Myxococcota bacterium]